MLDSPGNIVSVTRLVHLAVARVAVVVVLVFVAVVVAVVVVVAMVVMVVMVSVVTCHHHIAPLREGRKRRQSWRQCCVCRRTNKPSQATLPDMLPFEAPGCSPCPPSLLPTFPQPALCNMFGIQSYPCVSVGRAAAYRDNAKQDIRVFDAKWHQQ
eukprot:363159-Chlamydomonas_euryale.AAC.14